MKNFIRSDFYRIGMYAFFSLGIFLAIAVRACHGGIFGSDFIPTATRYGFICFFFSAVMWLFHYIVHRNEPTS